MKSGNLNFLELFGLLQACNGTPLPLRFTYNIQILQKQQRQIHTTKQFSLDVVYINSSHPASYSYVRPSWSRQQYWELCFILWLLQAETFDVYCEFFNVAVTLETVADSENSSR